MDQHAKKFYRQTSEDSPKGHFFKVIALHDKHIYDWNTIHALAPSLPKGWFELAGLVVNDRIEFLRDYWISKMPYHPKLQIFLTRFFNSMDDIGVFVVQQKFEDPYEVHLIYSLKNETGFFRGYTPAQESSILKLKNAFPDVIFPQDYLAFLQIHDGFCKTTDSTGITKSESVQSDYKKFEEMEVVEGGPLKTGFETMVDPKSLIPFYESFGMPFYQCFWTEWHPETEMGNVYYSGSTRTISDVNRKDPSSETMAFATFSDWLMFYLETIV